MASKIPSQISHCSFFYNNGVKAYMIIYVDDLILTENNSAFLQKFTATLSIRFSLRILGQLSYFLGIELVPQAEGVIMSQQNYIRDILEQSNMSGAKEASTSLTTSPSLCLNDGSVVVDGDEFQKLVGSLHYLTITRLDISFVVNKLSQWN